MDTVLAKVTDISDLSLPCGQMSVLSGADVSMSYAGPLPQSPNCIPPTQPAGPARPAGPLPESRARTIATQTGRTVQREFFYVNHWLERCQVSIN